MNELVENTPDYQRIEQAIWYLSENLNKQPGLEELASHVHLSPFHFQRMFTAWAGTSPKKFLQYLSVNYAKQELRRFDVSLFELSNQLGLSGTSRLHDLFVNIEHMTPGEYKNKGRDLTITYEFYPTVFGRILVASTTKGLCHLSFADHEDEALQHLFQEFEEARFLRSAQESHFDAIGFMNDPKSDLKQIKLHLKASQFQLKVWQLLLRIPQGHRCSYGDISQALGNPGAARAVGTAIGSNPIAYLIPCHRVIQASGKNGGYMWGLPKKVAILAFEAAHYQEDHGLLSP